MTKRQITPQIREYFQEIGRKRGNALKAKYGSDYFKNMASKRKTFGRKPTTGSASALATRFGMSRQRVYQILSAHGSKFKKSEYPGEAEWREAVLADFREAVLADLFENK